MFYRQRLRAVYGSTLPQSSDVAFISEEPFEREVGEIIGDFVQTLGDCKEILSKHKNKAGFIQNVVWAVATEKKVDSLRKRLQFHTAHINMTTNTIQVDFLGQIAGDTAELVASTRSRVLEAIPASVDAKFRTALNTGSPRTYESFEHFPLKEGYEASYQHYQDFKSGDQPIEKHLSLLKACWILEALKQSALLRRRVLDPFTTDVLQTSN
ncbi:hypothetical protein B0A49_10100 [Cryomyces minteri]|uniref:Uncharacterized protein n=1 Tax=Cryomyces minteri TaxID=331657 RepID=A0A4U0WUM4_9PEZI|nr:hypothetical protein B0A49_10100 [Cryomyces minteri]